MDARDLACQSLTFLPLDGSLCLLGRCANITEVSYLLIPPLDSRAPPYDEALNWLQFSNMGDQTGAYVTPALT